MNTSIIINTTASIIPSPTAASIIHGLLFLEWLVGGSIGFVGNVLLAATIWKTKELHSNTTRLLSLLATSDAVFSFFTFILVFTNRSPPNSTWVSYLCFWGILSAAIASVVTIAVSYNLREDYDFGMHVCELFLIIRNRDMLDAVAGGSCLVITLGVIVLGFATLRQVGTMEDGNLMRRFQTSLRLLLASFVVNQATAVIVIAIMMVLHPPPPGGSPHDSPGEYMLIPVFFLPSCLNAWANFIIYFGRSEEYRSAAKRLLGFPPPQPNTNSNSWAERRDK